MASKIPLLGWLHRRAENLLALVLGALFVSFLIQIVFRYLLNLPLGWTVEFVAIAWLWGILFGYAFVVSERDVIRLDIVYALLPRQVRRALDILTGLASAGIFLWTLPNVWDYVTFMKIEKTAYMKLPFNWVFSIYLPFALAVILLSLLTVWQAIRGDEPIPVLPAVAAEAHDYE
jgi:TRAP-type C4-dicarboxylate transport system permease small subunit